MFSIHIPLTNGVLRCFRWHTWRYLWSSGQWFGVFRNVDRNPALPRRWGFHILGLDIGYCG